MSRPLGEYDERLASMMTNMESHIKADAVAFAALIEEVKELNKDVKLLLTARTFAKAAWWTLGVISAIVVTVTGLYLAYIKH